MSSNDTICKDDTTDEESNTQFFREVYETDELVHFATITEETNELLERHIRQL